MGEYRGVLARYDIESGQSLGSWSAGDGLHGVALYGPPAPPPPDTGTNADPAPVQSTPSTVDTATPAAPTLVVAPSLAVAAPALAVTRNGRLVTSGRSLLLDTGLRATCPAGGPRCHATVALTVAAPGARAAGVHTTNVGTLRQTIAPGARARLVVRLNRKGAALVVGAAASWCGASHDPRGQRPSAGRQDERPREAAPPQRQSVSAWSRISRPRSMSSAEMVSGGAMRSTLPSPANLTMLTLRPSSMQRSVTAAP